MLDKILIFENQCRVIAKRKRVLIEAMLYKRGFNVLTLYQGSVFCANSQNSD